MHDNAAVEAFNFANNVDADGDGVADSQFSGNEKKFLKN